MKIAWWVVVTIFVAACCVALFPSSAQQKVSVGSSSHAVDPLVLNRNKFEFRAARAMQLIEHKNALAEIGATERQITTIKEILYEYDAQAAELWADWRKDHGSETYHQPFAADGMVELVSQTFKDIRSVLNRDQKNSLEQIELRSYGSEVLFLDDVRQELQLSEGQTNACKDWYLKRIVERNKRAAKWRDAGPEERVKLLQAFRQQSDLEDPIQLVLTNQQKELLDELLGLK